MLIKAKNRKVDGFCKEKEGKWTAPYTFIHSCDPQLGFTDERTGGDGLKWDKDLELTKQAIAAVNKMNPRPRFMFVNGDLVNAYPGTGPHKVQQENDLLKVFAESDIPILVTSGNHDIGIKPTRSTVTDFSSKFGDDYYSFYVGGALYIALNSQLYFDHSQAKDLADEQRKWLFHQVQRAKSEDIQHVVIFMHIPPFISSADEDDIFSNIPRETRMQLLEDFADAGVELVFSGHYHRNGGGTWTRLTDDGKSQKLEVVVTTAIGMQLGEDRSGLSVVSVQKDKISHKYFAIEDIPKAMEF